MKDESKFTKLEYLIIMAITMVFVAVNTYKVLPNVAYIVKFERSVVSFVLCMLVTTVIGLALNLKHKRKYLSIIFTAFSAVGLYIFITIGKYFPAAVIIMLILPVGLSAALGVLIFTTKIKTKTEWKRRIIIKKRIFRFSRVAAFVFGVMLMLGSIVLPVLVRVKPTKKYQAACMDYFINDFTNMGRRQVYSEEELVVIESYGDEYSFENNIDKIKLLRQSETFLALDYHDRCEVIEAFLAAEAKALGLFRIEVVFSDDELDEFTCAAYEHNDRSVTFNTKYIKNCKSAEFMIKVILHELRHCYQNMCSDIYVKATPEEKNLLVFRESDVAKWAANMNAYHDGDGGVEEYEEYVNQPIEADAEEWAGKEYMVVYEIIDKLVGEGEYNQK